MNTPDVAYEFLRDAMTAIANSAETMADAADRHSVHQRSNPFPDLNNSGCSEMLAQVSDAAAKALRTTVERLRYVLDKTPLQMDMNRCPSCDHEVSMHQADGCWYTVEKGERNQNLVCVCTVPRFPS